MANWCWSFVNVYGTEKQISNIKKHYELACKNGKIENDYGNGWLGHLLEYIGYEEKEVCFGNIGCSGVVDDWYDHEQQIVFYVSGRWSPQLEPLCLFLRKYGGKDIDIIYSSQESGSGIFWTNDPDLIGKPVYEDYNEDVPVYEYVPIDETY